MKTQLQSPSHWCWKGWCNHSWMPGSSEIWSAWCSCFCQILRETESKWYHCFQALPPADQSPYPRACLNQNQDIYLRLASVAHRVDMLWNWTGMEHPMRHTQIAEKMKIQLYKGSISIQIERKRSCFFLSNLFSQLGLLPSLLFTHFLLSLAHIQPHKRSVLSI